MFASLLLPKVYTLELYVKIKRAHDEYFYQFLDYLGNHKFYKFYKKFTGSNRATDNWCRDFFNPGMFIVSQTRLW